MKAITKRFIACAAFILASVGMSPLANAWTFYSSGTIDFGYDWGGVFGNPSSSLIGQTYSQLYTLDPSLFASQNFTSDSSQGSGSLTGSATDTVTVGGVSKTFTFDLNTYDGSLDVVNTLTQFGYGYDEAYLYNQGNLTDGSSIVAQSYAYSYANPFNIGPNFFQNWSYTLQPGDYNYLTEWFGLNTALGGVQFQGAPNFMSISYTSTVPEPPTYAMLLAGLGLIGFMTLRKQQNFAA